MLDSLVIHFNTTNIVGDFKDLSGDSRFQELRSLPRCALRDLDVYRTPLTLSESDLETVANGVVDIFPSLEYCEGCDEAWDEISERIAELQKM